MGIAHSVISVQFKVQEDNDDVASPSLHCASGAAEASLDFCPANAHFLPLKNYSSNSLLNYD